MWQKNTIESIIVNPLTLSTECLLLNKGLTYHLNNEWSFFLRRDGNFSFPKANEELWLPANVSALQPQTGVSYETGTTWLTEKQKIPTGLYRLQLHDEIAFNPTQTLSKPFGSFNNLDNTIRDGITITESYQLTPKLVFDSQLNYLECTFRFRAFFWQPNSRRSSYYRQRRA